MEANNASLETLQDIRRIMERSSRFISLSGLSGVAAGVCALIGAWIAHNWIGGVHYTRMEVENSAIEPSQIKWNFLGLAIGVFVAAIGSSFYFTWRKARQQGLPIWDHSSRKVVINLLIPLIAGGFFVLGLIYRNALHFIAPACLIFYGLALVNASKYTLGDIRIIGLLEIALGIINLYFAEFGLVFWALGFGILHIVYGVIMWWKYDKTASTEQAARK